MNTKKLVLALLLLAGIAAFFALDLGRFLNLAQLQRSLDELRAWRDLSPWSFALGYFGLYVLATALSFPGAVVLTLAGGAVFGLWWGTLIVSFASSIGATLAFLAARFLLRDWVRQQFGKRLEVMDQGLSRDGAFYLFTLRLVPLVPFVAINLAMGLTQMHWLTYYGVSQLGMLAGTLIYVNAGTQLAQLHSISDVLQPAMLASLVLLGLFPLLARQALQAYRKRQVFAPWARFRPRQFDRNLVVIGAGAAGLVTAYVAAAVRAKVSLVESGEMGGDCLNHGCVPSKALIRSARLAHEIRQSHAFGITTAQPQVDFPVVMRRVAQVIRDIAPHDSVQRYCDLGVDVVQGHARIVHPWGVEVTSADGSRRTITTRNIVIATGARPWVPDIPGLQECGFLTSDTLWQAWSKLDQIPRRLTVLGGGPIGCELAQACARLGAEVTLVELGTRLLAREDTDVSAAVESALVSEGVQLRLEHTVIRFETGPGQQRRIVTQHAGQIHSWGLDALLVAVGRVARLEGFGLEELGINPSRTVPTNDYLQTLFPNIYAAGDVAGPWQLTHAAAHQAWYAAVNALFAPWYRARVDTVVMPRVTFCDPEVASVGLNEQAASAAGVEFEVTRFDLDELDRAIVDGHRAGFVKILTARGSDRILGVTIVGEQAGELLAEYVLAMKHGIGLNRVLGTVHSYPTMAEANKYVAGQWKRAHAPERVLQWLARYHAWKRN